MVYAEIVILLNICIFILFNYFRLKNEYNSIKFTKSHIEHYDLYLQLTINLQKSLVFILIFFNQNFIFYSHPILFIL